MGTNGTIISMRSICKQYTLGKEVIPVLSDINLEIPVGDYVAIMGHSGAGKSTLLNIIGCLDHPTSGEYILNGKSVQSMSASRLAQVRNREIGFVFQNFNLLPKLTIAGNVELPLIYANIGTRERHRRVDEILEKFGLASRKKHRPNEISGGQKQRVAIARALVKNPVLLLADEPTGNLDSHTTDDILKILLSLNQEGNTILMITHEADVATHARRTLRLADGRFVQ